MSDHEHPDIASAKSADPPTTDAESDTNRTPSLVELRQQMQSWSRQATRHQGNSRQSTSTENVKRNGRHSHTADEHDRTGDDNTTAETGGGETIRNSTGRYRLTDAASEEDDEVKELMLAQAVVENNDPGSMYCLKEEPQPSSGRTSGASLHARSISGGSVKSPAPNRTVSKSIDIPAMSRATSKQMSDVATSTSGFNGDAPEFHTPVQSYSSITAIAGGSSRCPLDDFSSSDSHDSRGSGEYTRSIVRYDEPPSVSPSKGSGSYTRTIMGPRDDITPAIVRCGEGLRDLRIHKGNSSSGSSHSTSQSTSQPTSQSIIHAHTNGGDSGNSRGIWMRDERFVGDLGYPPPEEGPPGRPFADLAAFENDYTIGQSTENGVGYVTLRNQDSRGEDIVDRRRVTLRRMLLDFFALFIVLTSAMAQPFIPSQRRGGEDR